MHRCSGYDARPGALVRLTVAIDIAPTAMIPNATKARFRYQANFGNDIPAGRSVITFLPFLGQMADRRAFEPVVFLVSEPPSGDADSP
jgi:hypothetical protein